MAPQSPENVTRLLRAWSDGDESALEQLTPLVEAELRRLARGYMARERRGHTLQPTALINEAFIRLTEARGIRWQDRAHFVGITARLMRRVLIDHARARGYRKRGGDAQRVTFHEEFAGSIQPVTDLVALDRALDALAKVDARRVASSSSGSSAVSLSRKRRTCCISQLTPLNAIGAWRSSGCYAKCELASRDGRHTPSPGG
jgi:RNA polymerase sigma factor (TIGR02999 family)